jgi:hypothetical protein
LLERRGFLAMLAARLGASLARRMTVLSLRASRDSCERESSGTVAESIAGAASPVAPSSPARAIDMSPSV